MNSELKTEPWIGAHDRDDCGRRAEARQLGRTIVKSIASILLATGLALPSHGAERIFDFGLYPLNQTPAGFKSLVTGGGSPGEWKIIRDDPMPDSVVSPSSQVGAIRKTVLAQLSRDKTDERFPILMFDEDIYGDFTFTTGFKAVDGEAEQMAGIAFRIQDANNYYVVRASAKGSTFRFYKVINGQRGQPIGLEMSIPKGVWHELTVDARGNRFQLLLDGKEITTVTDDREIFIRGKIGFWTKSDSVSYFADAKINYVPVEPLIKVIVRDVLAKYPRILDMKVFASLKNDSKPSVVAAHDEQSLGQAATDVESNVLGKSAVYAAKNKDSYTITLPARDRNGDVVAAVQITLKTFKGQTEENAISRCLPIVKIIEERLKAAKDLTE